MESGDFGIECGNCECLVCINNDINCDNCNKCNGNISYNKWTINCINFNEVKNPEEDIKIILEGIKQ